MSDRYVYEALDILRHDRSAFSCGVEPLDRYFRQQAGQDVRNRVAAVYVQRAEGDPQVLGFYSLSNLSIEPTALTPEHVHPVLQATLIGRLAVDQRYRGKGLGALLLFDALTRSLRSGIGSVAVVVDAKDANAGRFYEHFGFQPVVGVHGRLYQMMKDIQTLLI